MADDVAPADQGKRTWRSLVTGKRIVGAIILIAALLFVFQNTQTGDFHFLWFDIKAPRWVWLLGVYAAGFASCWLFMRRRSAKASGS